MHDQPLGLSPALRRLTAAAATLCVVGTGLSSLGAAPASADPADERPQLSVDPSLGAAADIGFHDYTRDGSERPLRDDLAGELGGMVEFVQSTTSDPSGNQENDHPDVVADRMALMLFTPTSEITGASAEVRVDGEVKGTVDLAPPRELPASDQSYDERGSVAYSLRAWSAELPADWVQPGMTMTVTDEDGSAGTLDRVDIAAPDELVLNNIRLGMLTDAPESEKHRFIVDPAAGATDYFQTLPISKLTVAQYETVELDEVIVGSGDIYTVDSPDPSEGSVYAGTMREDVGKAQVSTGINLATWGITSSPMSQEQPGHTNQRVIHHSAGQYANGRQEHGLSGGNGMATLHSSVGNELSHELGHSYGLGHYPGQDDALGGDDAIRDAVHHMDSGWGYIPYRGLMRSNLDTGEYDANTTINGVPFGENLAGKYNFNTDAMSGGWDDSPVSDYTLHTAYSLTRIQDSLEDLVADTEYPSGYRAWDSEAGTWADAAALDPDFSLRAPAEVGVPVFTILGGYNPADAEQTLVYPAFRSNYGVTFDLPQADPAATAPERACWLEVSFADAETQHIELDPSDGVKQLNVNIAESEAPTGAQVRCKTGDTVTDLGSPIDIETDLAPMDDPTVVGGEAGFDELRAQELASLEPKLAEQSGSAAPVLGADDLRILQGWADDLSPLSGAAREVAETILSLESDARDVEAFLAEHVVDGAPDSEESMAELAAFLEARGHLDERGQVLPAGSPVTVADGHCLFLSENTLRVRPEDTGCATDGSGDGSGSGEGEGQGQAAGTTGWFADLLGRIHPADRPEMCVQSSTPMVVGRCSLTTTDQRWDIQDNGQVLREANPEQAMDYFRESGTVGVYGTHGNAHQIWKTFETSDNALLAYLSADALSALSAAGDLPEPAEPSEPEQPIEPEKPVDPEKPTEPEEPEEPVDPEQPSEPGDTDEPGDADGAEDADDAETPGDSEGSEDADTADDPVGPSGADDSDGESDSSAPAGPSAPNDPASPAEPTQPTQAGAAGGAEETGAAETEGSDALLAKTGMSVVAPLLLGAALLVAGGVMVVARRRRSQR